VVAGKVGNCYHFDGTGDFITASGTGSLALSNHALTVECWAQYSAIPGAAKYPNLVAKQADTAGYGIYFNGDQPDVRKNVITAAGWYNERMNQPSVGVWYRYAMKLSGTSLTGLVDDGADYGGATAGANAPAATTNTLLMGRHYSDGATYGFMHGLIDDVRVSDIARTDGWIEATYHNTNTPGDFAAPGTAGPASIPVDPADGRNKCQDLKNNVNWLFSKPAGSGVVQKMTEFLSDNN
jgi:hypothetical protein